MNNNNDDSEVDNNKIATLNKKFFGDNKQQIYISDIFYSIIEGIIQVEVLVSILSKTNKNYIPDSVEKKSCEVHGINCTAYGSHDPDNSIILGSIIDNFYKGFMVDVRLLLNKNEESSGASFVKELCKLESKDFIDYYLRSSKEKDYVIIPKILTKAFKSSQNTKPKQSGSDFINNHSKEVEEVTKGLIEKAKNFNSKNYHSIIIKDYEKLKFHNDKEKEKYEVKVTESTISSNIKFRNTKRKEKATIKLKTIAEALNELAEIITIYKSLTNVKFDCWRNDSLSAYIEKIFALFKKEVSRDIQEKLLKNIEKCLSSSLELLQIRTIPFASDLCNHSCHCHDILKTNEEFKSLDPDIFNSHK